MEPFLRSFFRKCRRLKYFSIMLLDSFMEMRYSENPFAKDLGIFMAKSMKDRPTWQDISYDYQEEVQ